ncbi:vgr related protein [Sandaracinobacteroides saxicola]|uniref:vgr related protein n=1 Tax=Sandaracinobacteroides saxicola TaxID=2759707 RepID=UPI0037DA73B7
MARVFGAAVDPGPVRIRQQKYWMWQPAWVTMAPDGDLWFHPNGDNCCADFAATDIDREGHFIHEMTHVWQVQIGGNLLWRRLPWAPYRYLPLVPGKPFAAYGLEQQAEMVREAWMLARGLRLPGRPALADYAAIIPFFQP